MVMNIITREDIQNLLKKQEGVCVSLYSPMEKSGDTQQNPIRFKNLLSIVEKHLIDRGFRENELKDYLSPIKKFQQDSLFWEHQSDGLAVFLSKNFFHSYRQPYHFKELVFVADHFHIKPLLPLLVGDGRFFILAISQNSIKLMQGTRYTVNEIDLEGVPEGLASVIRQEGMEKLLQFHTGTPTTRGDRSAIFFGHGAGYNTKEIIQRYFQVVNKSLHEYLRNEKIPLVLAGVDYLLPIYREVNTYPYLLEEGIEGNPENLTKDKLHEKVWKIVEPIFYKAQREALEKCEALLQKGEKTTSIKLEDIIPAAYHGRIDTLFVAIGIEKWGRFDPDNNQIIIHEKNELGDTDLLDFCANQVLRHSGSVFALKTDAIPGNSIIAAIYRY
jgi:hypothetical protein